MTERKNEMEETKTARIVAGLNFWHRIECARSSAQSTNHAWALIITAIGCNLYVMRTLDALDAAVAVCYNGVCYTRGLFLLFIRDHCVTVDK